MRQRLLVRMILLGAFGVALCTHWQDSAAAQGQVNAISPSLATGEAKNNTVDTQPGPTGPKLEEIIDRIIKRENEQMAAFEDYHPLIETYIQQTKPDQSFGTVPKSDYYFLGQANFRGHLKVRSMLESTKKGSLLWTFEPDGFLQMAFVDRGGFDKLHYRFDYVRREFQGEVRCLVFELSRTSKARGARFTGKIWVEDQDYTIVHISGTYSPPVHFSLKTLEDEYYVHFDAWRTNVKPGLWLPSYIYSEEITRPSLFGNPSYKSSTNLWGYKLKQGSHEEELSRLLVESANPVKDETPQHYRSPLEAQREWRHRAENNVLDLLEHVGLLAPPGEVDSTLNTIVNNLEVTNNLDGRIDLHCRVLLTSNLEMFSVGSTIVLSRGLIDVLPDEESLAAILAHEVADAMLPKPYQDEYGFSDILRLSPTEVIKRLSFEEEKSETTQNSEKALELLKKSPYESNLSRAGLFLSQLQSKAKQLKQLISPRLGNPVFFSSQSLQAAPALEPNSKDQIAALPLGSRIKIDPWTSGVSLMKTKPVARFSARDKLPFEVTPLIPYLTRYVEPSTVQTPAGSAAGVKQRGSETLQFSPK